MGELTVWNEAGEVLLDIRKVVPEKRDARDGTLSTGEAAKSHYVEFDNLGTEKQK